MFNLAVLTGRLTTDPELKTTLSGISVTTFSIAVDRAYKSGEEKQTDFINIVAWRQTAEFICKYFKKGNLIGIEGSIQTRKYQDKNGNNRIAFEVITNNAHFIESKKNAEDPLLEVAKKIESHNLSGNDNDDMFAGIEDDDIPF